MNQIKQYFKSVCLLMTLFVIACENIGYGQTTENPYISKNCGLAVTSTVTTIDAFLGEEVKWNSIVATYSQTPTGTQERFPRAAQFTLVKTKVEHKWLASASYTPNAQVPGSVAHTVVSTTNGAFFNQITFTPVKAGYTKGDF
jgi:hypothetical protein